MQQHGTDGRVGATFTSEDHEAVRQWVQDKAVQQEIIATPTRLYLPVGLTGMVTVDEGDVIWFDPDGGDNAFSLDRA